MAAASETDNAEWATPMDDQTGNDQDAVNLILTSFGDICKDSPPDVHLTSKLGLPENKDKRIDFNNWVYANVPLRDDVIYAHTAEVEFITDMNHVANKLPSPVHVLACAFGRGCTGVSYR